MLQGPTLLVLPVGRRLGLILTGLRLDVLPEIFQDLAAPGLQTGDPAPDGVPGGLVGEHPIRQFLKQAGF